MTPVCEAVATKTLELVRYQPLSKRAELHFDALCAAASSAEIRVDVTETYRGHSEWLLCWGPGAPDRVPAQQRQLAQGGHWIGLDLSYWSRNDKARYTIDAPHPQQWVMARDWPVSRLQRDPFSVLNTWNPKGFILFAGVGPKAVQQYGGQIERWEYDTIKACRAFNRPLRYKVKKAGGDCPWGVDRVNHEPIEDSLKGCALLVTWHSNAAIDAIRHGVPVICRDGAAAAVCPDRLPEEGLPQPLDPAVRDRFLANLAWFQWLPSEAKQAWAWLRELLP